MPDSDVSSLRQDWAHSVAVANPYRRVPETLRCLLDVHPSVASLERMTLKMAEPGRSFRASRPTPAPAEDGALCVVSADAPPRP